jgi:hypothetical protein
VIYLIEVSHHDIAYQIIEKQMRLLEAEREKFKFSVAYNGYEKARELLVNTLAKPDVDWYLRVVMNNATPKLIQEHGRYIQLYNQLIQDLNNGIL